MKIPKLNFTVTRVFFDLSVVVVVSATSTNDDLDDSTL